MDNFDKSFPEEFNTENKARNRLVSLLITIAIILSFVFYFFPFQHFLESKPHITKVYFAENMTKAHFEIIKRFNEKYKGQIEVIPIDLPYSKFTTNKRKELITRNLRNKSSRIDLYAVDQIWMPRFAKWATPLDLYFSKEETGKFLSQAVSTCVYNDTLYGIPFFIDIGVMYYRSDLINQIPNAEKIKKMLTDGITWNQLIKLRNKYFPNKYLYVFQGDDYEGLICNFLEVLGGAGGRLFSKNILPLNKEAAIKSCQFMTDLIHKYKISPPKVTEFNESDSYKYAIGNDIPFFRGWPTALKNMSVAVKDTYKLKYLKIVPLPHFAGNLSASAIGGWNLMVSRNSPVKEAAIQFIKFAVSEESQSIIYSTSGYLPIINQYYSNDSLLSKYPLLKSFKRFINQGVKRPAHPQYTKISDVLAFYLKEALNEKLSARAAFNHSEKQISKILISNENFEPTLNSAKVEK